MIAFWSTWIFQVKCVLGLGISAKNFKGCVGCLFADRKTPEYAEIIVKFRWHIKMLAADEDEDIWSTEIEWVLGRTCPSLIIKRATREQFLSYVSIQKMPC
jgi:hypothetical protein